MVSLPIYILSGGRCSRFGTDKARALVHGEPLVVQAARPFASVASTITVVAAIPDKYGDLGFRTLGDRVPDQGPLGGLETALLDQETEGWLLMTSCDFLGARAAWVKTLHAHCRPGAHAVAFKGTHWEPMFALYHTSSLPHVQGLLQADEHRAWKLLDTVDTVAVMIPDDWHHAASINTPEALAEFEARDNDAG